MSPNSTETEVYISEEDVDKLREMEIQWQCVRRGGRGKTAMLAHLGGHTCGQEGAALQTQGHPASGKKGGFPCHI